ncbi:MAG: four helix bundle suffix domain-containing protein [Acidobacteriota bacterium]
MERKFIPPHGGYRNLLSWKKAEIIFDATARFCERFLEHGDRTIDQMIQAARSGKQNIIEGSRASGTSKQTEIKLTGVARSSLEELLADFEDFLRRRGLRIWEKDSPEAKAVRRMARHGDGSYEIYRPYVETRSAETVANIILCLIHQTNYLLDRQILRLERDFVSKGGVRERMRKARMDFRRRRWRES